MKTIIHRVVEPRTKPEPIPFDLDKYKSGEYDVVTRDGRSARIICTDRKSKEYPIIALIDDGYCEDDNSFSSTGKWEANEIENPRDLLLVPKNTQELPKDFWMNEYNGKMGTSAHQSIEIANEHAMNINHKLICTAIHHYKHEWED